MRLHEGDNQAGNQAQSHETKEWARKRWQCTGKDEMNKTYWIVRYRAQGRKKAHPILTTLRHTRYDSIRASYSAWEGETWTNVKRRVDLECVKVQLIDPIAAPYIAKL